MNLSNLINFLINNPCEDPNILKVILFIRKIMEVAFIAVPIVLIVLITFDFVKSVTAATEDAMKKNQKIVVKRLIYAVMLFFVMPIVNIVFSAFGTSGNIDKISDNGVSYLSCWDNANSIDTINSFVIKVKFDGNGGNVYGDSIKTCGGKDFCKISDFPRVTKRDSNFIGWSKSSDCSGAKVIGNTVIAKNLVLQTKEDNEEIFDEIYYACYEPKTLDESTNSFIDNNGSEDIKTDLPAVKYEENKQFVSYYDKTNKKVYLYRCPNEYSVVSTNDSDKGISYSCKKQSSNGIYDTKKINYMIIQKYSQGNYSDNSACGGGTLVKKGCLPTSGAMIFGALQNKINLTPSDMNKTAKTMIKNGYSICSGKSYNVQFLLEYAQDNNVNYNTLSSSDYSKIIDLLKSNNAMGIAPLSPKSGCYNKVKDFSYNVGHFVVFFAAENLDSGYVNVIDPGKSASPIYNVSLNDLVLSTQNDMVRVFYK